MDAAHLKVLQFEQDSAVAAARGQFGAADALRQRAIAGRDAIERDQSFQQKMDSGAFTHEEALAAVEAEQRTREADRVARRDVFRAEKIRELRAASLGVSDEDGAAEELAKENVQCEIIDLRSLRPLDHAPIVESVHKTGRAVVVQEAWPFGGVGAEVVDRLQREAFDDLAAPVLRVTGRDASMPYNKKLEDLTIPDAKSVVAAVQAVMKY